MIQLIQHLKQHPPEQPQAVWGVGCSGGLDSMVLADALVRAGRSIRLLHFNHNWRGAESRRDAARVRRWAVHHGVPVTIKTWQNPIRSEDAARQARLGFFAASIKRHRLAGVLLAHHADDVAETFLLQLLRGAGPEGLSGPRAEHVINGLRLIRPLIGFRKADLQRHASHWNVPWCEDPSNQSGDFTRNRVRHHVLPTLQSELGRDPTPLLVRTATILAEENAYWQTLLPEVPTMKLSVADLNSLHPAHQRRLIRHWLTHQQVSAPTFEQIDAIRLLITRTHPARVNLNSGWFCRRRAGFLFIEPPHPAPPKH